MVVTRSRWTRWLRRLGFGVLALVLLAALGITALLAWTLPPSQGSVRLAGLGAPVAIGFDGRGIPRIAARDERDAAMALGWLHARDRMFQMELMRRGAAGRLSELVGASALRLDRFTRTLGLARRARADLDAQPPETRAVLEAYAAGVNAWIAERGRRAAPEFLALGAPEPWRPEDSLLWGKVMGLWLSGNWREELLHARLAALLPPERLRDLWPEETSAGRPDQPQAALDPAALGRLAAALPAFPAPFTLPGSASNAWTVAGARSASGAPLLASDPHLGFQAPILWYLARIDLEDGRMLAGATSPGVPFLVIGRNARLAWGFTTTQSDTQDVFVERLAGPDAYETPDGPRPFTVIEERIAVRGGETEILRVRETRHGPVLSDLEGMPAAEGTVLAVAMANLAPADTAAAGLHALNRAGSVEEARGAAALITSPSQNLMTADAAGHIGLLLTGRTPVRRSGDGTLPVPGWDGAADWTGWVPFDSLPHRVDPPGGILANANNRVAPPGGPVFLGRDWIEDWRFRRIGQMLAARERHEAGDFVAMQRDTVSLLARVLTGPDSLLRGLPPAEGAAGTAQALLLAWDGDVAADRPQPLIFHTWLRRVGQRALRAGGVPEGTIGAHSAFLRRVLAPDNAGAAWCEGDCRALAARALAEAVAELQGSEGPDPAAWRWGNRHVARFEHPVLRAIPGLGAAARLEAVTGGDEWTVSRGGLRGGTGPEAWEHVHGAGLRLVADLADPDATFAIIATGQSGHPLSLHWGDLLPIWRDGGMVALGRSMAEGAPAIQLMPQGPLDEAGG
ncbi:penicillin acylase family protein [Belnapia sp. T6]|uniref:Penicillin acylase family protein n=1 Tax=Belnapia mucosa TaxID=2804532 RepID=A0ABS1V0D4_9PROT|nr:penicillin acylase family protein [Belnapia mucosa]MBL6455175.1 penicillin acylase family protein [Belnapia mucosa]